MPEKKPDWRSVLEAVVDERRRDLGPHPELDDLVAYRAGELAAEASRQLRDHLVLCRDCASLLLELDAFAAESAAADPDPARSHGTQVATIGAHQAGRRSWAAAGLAAAAVAALLTIRPWVGPLPEYRLAVEGGELDRSTREVEDERRLLAADGRLSVVLQPAAAVAGDVTARAYVRRGAELRALSGALLEVSGDGAVSLEGKIGTDLHLPAGDSELLLAVARPVALPPRLDLRDAPVEADPGRARRWRAFGQPIRVDAPEHGPRTAQPPPADGPRIEYDGCRTVERGPICLLGEDRRLTLWIRHDPGATVEIDGGSLVAAGTAVRGGGSRYQIDVHRRAKELEVEVHDAPRRLIWALEVEPAPSIPAWLTEAREAETPDRARRLLEPRRDAPDPADRGAALGRLARLERRDGPSQLADRYFERALAAHRQAGRLLDEVDGATAWAFYLVQEARFEEARALLDALHVDALGGAARARYWVAYQRGFLAEATGDLRGAMDWMERAARAAERAGLIREQVFSDDLLAVLLDTVGLVDAAAAARARLHAATAELCPGGGARLDTCDCARFLLNRAWSALLALEADRPAEDPSPLLQEAERIFAAEQARGDAGCTFPSDLPNTRLNLALAALHADDPVAARHHWAGAGTADPPWLRLWRLDIEARIWSRESKPDRALERYRELARRAAAVSAPEAEWRAASGTATALAALGKTGEAADACAEAEDLLDRESLLVPMHTGRERFIAQREPTARFCIDLLLRASREDEAVAAARRSTARALASLRAAARIRGLAPDARRQWKETAGVYRATRGEIEELAAEIAAGVARDRQDLLESRMEDRRRALRELLDRRLALAGGAAPDESGRPPPPGTILLVYHPLPQGWAAFAVDDDGATAARIAEALSPTAGSADELARLLLQPFAEHIVRASEVQVVAYGELRSVDFHALPFASGILLEHAPVAYRLDLPALAGAPPEPSPRALVVADPGLREAPAEGRAVRRLLEKRDPRSRQTGSRQTGSRQTGWQVETFAGGAAPELARRLAEIDLLHYAGHARFDDHTWGWASYLSLGRTSRLTVDDILAAAGVPRWVVLSGCETGLDDRGARLPTIGLAQAFLVAGAQAVIAAAAEVSDRDARALAETLYRHWDPPATPLSAALRSAQLELRERDPGSGWRRFRLLVR